MFSNIPCCSINNFIRCNKECWMYCLFSSGYGWLCTAWVEVHKNISERDNALWVIYKHAHGVNTACLQYCLLGGCLRAVFQHAYQTVTLTFIWSHTFQILSGEALIYNDTWIGAAKPPPIFLFHSPPWRQHVKSWTWLLHVRELLVWYGLYAVEYQVNKLLFTVLFVLWNKHLQYRY